MRNGVHNNVFYFNKTVNAVIAAFNNSDLNKKYFLEPSQKINNSFAMY